MGKLKDWFADNTESLKKMADPRSHIDPKEHVDVVYGAGVRDAKEDLGMNKKPPATPTIEPAAVTKVKAKAQ